MTLNDLHAAQIESIYFILLTLGAYTFCLCMTAYICTKMIAEAITANAALLAGEVSKQKVVIEVPVYSENAAPYGQAYLPRISNNRVMNGSISS